MRERQKVEGNKREMGVVCYLRMRMRMRMSFNILIPKVTFTSGAV